MSCISDRVEEKRVLVADDEKNVRRAFSMILQGEGYAVDLAEDGIQALDIYTRNKNYDLIFLDWKMPEMDGMEVMHRIKQNGCEAPVVLISAHDIKDYKWREAGFSEFLPKPVNRDLLMQCIEKYLK